MPRICPPVVSEETPDAKGLQEGFELLEHLVLTAAEHIRQNFPNPMIEGMLEPPRFFLLAHIAPYLVNLCGLYAVNVHFHIAGMQMVDQGSIYRRESRSLFFSS